MSKHSEHSAEGAEGAESPAKPQESARRVHGWVVFWAALMAPVALVALGLLLSRENDGTPSPGTPAEAAARPCDPLRLESCSASEACVAGRCRELRPEPRCDADAPGQCIAARCAPGLESVHGRCLPPARVPLAPRRCREPASNEATIRDLQRRCAAHLGEPGAPLTACSSEFWERELREHEALERRLHALPNAISLHFPPGQPAEAPQQPAEASRGRLPGRGAPRWPSDPVTSHYRQALKDHHQALATARAVVVVGRASARTGDRALNRRLAEHRAAWAASLSAEVLAAEGATVPIIEIALASDFALPPEDFHGLIAGRVASPQPPDLGEPAGPRPGLIAWDRETEAWLRQDVEQYAAGATDPESWSSLSATLNQVAWVLPLPCDGREFFPEPSFPKDSVMSEDAIVRMATHGAAGVDQ